MGNTKQYNRKYYLQHRQYYLDKAREYRKKEKAFTDPNDTLVDELATREHQTEEELRALGIKSVDIENDAVILGNEWRIYSYAYETYSVMSYGTYAAACKAIKAKCVEWETEDE